MDAARNSVGAAAHEMFGTLAAETVARIRERSERQMGRWPAHVREPYWRSVAEADATRFLQTTDLPVLELYGDRGEVNPDRDELLIPERSNITLRWVRHGGHYLPTEQPEVIGSLIGEWLCGCAL